MREAAVCWHLRNNQGASAEQIAQRLNYGSVEALRKQFEIWELPGWLLQERSTPQPHTVRKQTPAKKRRAKSVRGEKLRLPPAKQAAPLFREALEKLLGAVAFLESDYQGEANSRYITEYLQNGRFFQYIREEAHWADPELGRTGFFAAGQAPGNGLTELITMYLLTGGDPEQLLQKLHPCPDDLNRADLQKVLYGDKNNNKPGLLSRVAHSARLIRGADLTSGAGPAELSANEQKIRWQITQGRREGYSDGQIMDVLAEEGTPVSQAELERLAEFDPPDPIP
jgi:hypothetical protein